MPKINIKRHKNTQNDIDIRYKATYNVLKKEGDIVYKEKTANYVRLKTDAFLRLMKTTISIMVLWLMPLSS